MLETINALRIFFFEMVQREMVETRMKEKRLNLGLFFLLHIARGITLANRTRPPSTTKRPVSPSFFRRDIRPVEEIAICYYTLLSSICNRTHASSVR